MDTLNQNALSYEPEEVYRTIFELIDEGFSLMEKVDTPPGALSDFRYLLINPAFERHSGLKEVIGKTMHELLPDAGPLIDRYDRIVLTGESVRFEAYVSSVGIWIDAQAFRVNGPGRGQVAVLFTNITERRQAEAVLQKSRQRLQKTLSIPTLGVLFFDSEGTFTDANDAFLTMSGVTRRAIERQTLNTQAITLPEWMPATRKALKKLKASGRFSPYEKQLVRPDGSRWWGLCTGTQLSETENVEFILDITGRKQAEEALQEANRRKDEFLALLAHELRNPMATLSNTLLLLQLTGGKGDTLSLESAIAMMSREVTHLVRLVDDLLDISRINQGKTELQRRPLDLTDLVRQAIETARPLVEVGHRQFWVSLPDEPLFLNGDATRLNQIIRNLLMNAATFTHDGGHIGLSLERVDGEARLRVQDNGIGIATDQLDRIFEMFTQVDASHTRLQDGLGLGLTLVREFVELHGGRVEAHSEGLGMGSEFVVYLPLPEVTT